MSDNLSFTNYQEEIQSAVKDCADEKLHLFCREVVFRILSFVDKADTSDLYESEINLLEVLKHEARNYPFDLKTIKKSLAELSEINEQDEEHGLDMDGSIVEFLCALDNLRSFRETNDRDYVCGISENLMNILDFNFVEDTPLNKWLTVPEINIEFHKQISFLRNNQ